MVERRDSVLEFHPRYDLGYRLEFRPRGTPRKAAVWLDSVGDWGYGVEIPGVRIRGTWIRLFGAPLPATSWINGALLRADAGSIEGRLVTRPRLLAVWLRHETLDRGGVIFGRTDPRLRSYRQSGSAKRFCVRRGGKGSCGHATVGAHRRTRLVQSRGGACIL